MENQVPKITTVDIEQVTADLAKTFSPEQLRERWERGVVFTGEAVPLTDEQVQKLAAHVGRVRQEPKTVYIPMRQHKPEAMQYDEARRKFWAILQFRAAAIETLTGQPFEWRFTSEEAAILQCLVRYFTNDPEPFFLPNAKKPVALHKGLFIYGEPGTGKTEIMLALQKFCDAHGMEKAFKFTSMSAVHIQTKTDKEFDPVSENVQHDRCFDEFCRHAGAVIRFGDALDINEAIVELRYERWKRYGQLSHFIANATPNDVETLFSPMVFDRIREMCTSVPFPGKSKRK